MTTYKIGSKVKLINPYNGYRHGEIQEILDYTFLIKLDNGLTLTCYEDEFEVLD
jgi:hypothetical protein